MKPPVIFSSASCGCTGRHAARDTSVEYKALTIQKPPRRLAKTMRHARKRVLILVATRWHRNYLPRHFAANAQARYRYKFRSPNYNKKKQRRRGHQLPLVWSGNLKRMMTGPAALKSSSKKAAVVMRGPRYLYAFRKDSRQPDKAAEIVRTTKGEYRELTKFFHAEVNKDLQADTG